MIGDELYWYLFIIVGAVVAICLLLYLRNKQKREYAKEIRKNRIAIFSSMTKEEFEDSKKILDYGNVTEEEKSLLKKDDDLR